MDIYIRLKRNVSYMYNIKVNKWTLDINCGYSVMHFHLPIRRRTYIYLGGLTSGLKFVGKVYVVAK